MIDVFGCDNVEVSRVDEVGYQEKSMSISMSLLGPQYEFKEEMPKGQHLGYLEIHAIYSIIKYHILFQMAFFKPSNLEPACLSQPGQCLRVRGGSKPAKAHQEEWVTGCGLRVGVGDWRGSMEANRWKHAFKRGWF